MKAYRLSINNVGFKGKEEGESCCTIARITFLESLTEFRKPATGGPKRGSIPTQDAGGILITIAQICQPLILFLFSN